MKKSKSWVGYSEYDFRIDDLRFTKSLFHNKNKYLSTPYLLKKKTNNFIKKIKITISEVK